jgi:GNAT superfamily N-acetyltransferase
MEIKKLTEEDYDRYIVLYRQLDEMHIRARPDHFVHREDLYPREHYLHNLQYPDCVDFGVFEGDALIGFAGATLWNESGMVKGLKTVCLDNNFVLPEYRRWGIAARLFEEIEAWAREQGAVRLDLHTWEFNQSAIALYREMGMTPQRYVFEKKL